MRQFVMELAIIALVPVLFITGALVGWPGYLGTGLAMVILWARRIPREDPPPPYRAAPLPPFDPNCLRGSIYEGMGRAAGLCPPRPERRGMGWSWAAIAVAILVIVVFIVTR